MDAVCSTNLCLMSLVVDIGFEKLCGLLLSVSLVVDQRSGVTFVCETHIVWVNALWQIGIPIAKTQVQCLALMHEICAQVHCLHNLCLRRWASTFSKIFWKMLSQYRV